MADYVDLLGAGSGGELENRVQNLEAQVAQLLSQRQSGNIFGGIIHANIGPGAYTQGPYRMDVDSTYGLQMDIWIPDYLLRLSRCQLRIKPGASRTASAVSASSGTLTSDSGGGATSGADAAHTHNVSGQTAQSAGSSSPTSAAGSSHSHGLNSVTTQAENASHSHTTTVGVELATHTHNETGGVTNIENQTHNHAVTNSIETASHGHALTGSTSDAEAAHTHVVNVPAHTHTVDSVTSAGGSSHTHTTPNHTHTIPGHTHALTLSITESGMAAGLHVWLDGVDRTVALGGPWGAPAVLDITQWLVNVSGDPIDGAHPLLITSTATGSVEVCLDFYTIVKPPSG